MQTMLRWIPGGSAPAFVQEDLTVLAANVREPAYIVRSVENGALGLALGGDAVAAENANGAGYPLAAMLPALYPEWLGGGSFTQAHGVRFAYIAGEMANGIATARMVIAMAKAGMMGFFGAAGLPLARVQENLDVIQAELDPVGLPWGINLIHTPNEPAMEEHIVDLYIRRGVRRVSASAFMGLTPSIVRYACSGLTLDASGVIRRRNHLFAKISRPEVAGPFMSPAPEKMLVDLVRRGLLTAEEARLAAYVPLAEDITVEADSGGHTDNRPLTALFPAIMRLRDDLQQKYRYASPIRIGASGGLGTPAAVAAAFALGAAYVMTGSVNQSAVESGLSEEGRAMLATAGLADVVMAPAADMFEQGVKVQVLKRGTLFSSRGFQLLELYRSYNRIEDLPDNVRLKLEKEVFQAPLDQIWADTARFFEKREPGQLERAARDPKHKMALIFRWYLGKASRWAIDGAQERKLDYQIWCGPAMGSFNAWVEGSFLEQPHNRTVVQIACNLLEGAAAVTRAQQLRSYGLPVPAQAFDYRPRLFQL
ncbi:PfaD family polyunsaturated fatty acid/polyketide biosynthesis protein [Paenibacillus sp. MMS18-CY102]|uniref:PfaD family polyunsaturated fatty acid/polyketide biosynthesis protein n=1 Tax=Paenibacillus sp. MMS18-CY102 TaxID=2682849 RepID=UPI0013663BEB|nr:PfaD family polyunsaturated fatty acid/polyketide biosynthesis protein [Paenibacillus sp. MMS18-CY102]MWC29609.1 PfaD family polyunsaturated fatty acid/polyketide biosynthesis protein [Paenibacillus sp. MMS18-CY102]